MRNLRPLLTSLILLAFFIKALVPAGFMPGETPDGARKMVICTGHGPATTIDVIAPFPVPGEPAQKAKHSCPFAPVVAQGTQGLEPAALFVLDGTAIEAPALAQSFTQKAAAKSWQAQGPPLLTRA